MVTIDLQTLLDAKGFSDWRLYPDIERSCALQGIVSMPDADTRDRKRTWIDYAELPENLRIFTSGFLNACVASEGWSTFAVEFGVAGSNERIRYRIQALGGFFACRALFSEPTDLDDIEGVTSDVRDLVMSGQLGTSGGMVLMVGNAGTGKSVFAASAMRHRLKTFGGHCVVVGDPPEQPVGDHGLSKVGSTGYVDTVDVSKIGYTAALSMVLRSYPTGKKGSLLFSEIRSDSNAFDLVNSAINGHVVFATMHALSADAALDRLISWCVRGGVPIDVVRNMLAQSLFGMTHHRLDHGRFLISAYHSNQETRQRIREGHPMPLKASVQTKFERQ